MILVKLLTHKIFVCIGFNTMSIDEAWVSEKLTEFKSALFVRHGEEAVNIILLQDIIAREKTNYCIEKQKGLEVRKQLDDLRKENKNLSDNLYVQKYVRDMMQRLMMQSQLESDLATQKREYEVKLDDEMMSRNKLTVTLALYEAEYKEMKIEVNILKAKLSATASGFDDKVDVEVARATVAFNDKLATKLFDVAAHFDAMLVAELAVASTAAYVKHAAELASVFA